MWVLVVIGIHFASDGRELNDLKVATFASERECRSEGEYIERASTMPVKWTCGRIAGG